MSDNKIDDEDRDSELSEHHPYREMRDKSHYIPMKPHCIYYYHVTDITTDPWTVRHYYVSDNGDIRRQDLPKRSRELGRNGKRQGHAPPKYGDNLEYITWTRISYVMFLFDIPGVRLKRNKKAVEVNYKDDQGKKQDNHSFFDAGNFAVDLSDKEDDPYLCDVAFCVNYLQKDMDGHRLADDEGQDFVFNFNFESALVNGKPIRRQPDSGGTNQGGGVPPPDL